MFRVGQKVVCVDAGPSKWSSSAHTLVDGAIYTVTRAWVHQPEDHPVVTLAEVLPPEDSDCFDALRFRPIVERKTDISIFTAMLTPNKLRESADS